MDEKAVLKLTWGKMLVLENDIIYTQEKRSHAAHCSKKKQVISHLCHKIFSCQMRKYVYEKMSFLLGLQLRDKDRHNEWVIIHGYVVSIYCFVQGHQTHFTQQAK